MDEGMTKQEWKEKDERILKSGIMKSIHEGGRLPEGPIEVQKVWLKDMFDYSVFLVGLNPNGAILTGNVSPPVQLSKSTPIKAGNTKLNVENVTTSIERVSKKEYKPGKFLYGVQDTEGVWYSTFFKVHFEIAAEAKASQSQTKIFYEATEYKGKPQRNIQSIEMVS